MGSSPAFRAVFAAEPHAATGVSFARYMELALFHPTVGYYTSPTRRRVGRDKGADFYTATSFSPVFGELVACAAVGLLAGKNPADYELVEVGAEPGAGAFRDVAHPFKAYRTISLGQSLEVRGRCVLFSNELFDAQPFHRVVRRNGVWRELGVALEGDELREVLLPEMTAELAAAANRLPAQAPENYHIDLPLRTIPMLRRLIDQPWTGLFLAFDYGRSWNVLAEEMPQGSVRTYSHQKQGDDVIDRPGEIDLTGHICWDWLVDELQQNGFGEALVESQEAFLAKRAAAVMQTIVSSEAGRFSRRKNDLMHLLHPGNMGQKFQALHALRE
jgi:SAM-dependent MidA family methyltransferase